MNESPKPRGQGSFEYLIDYAWALVVIMIVGAIFWQIGLLSENKSTISSTGFTFFKLITGMSESKGGLTVLYFQNTLPEQVRFNITQSTVTYTPTGAVCPVKIISPETVQGGGIFKIEVQKDFATNQPCVPPEAEGFGLELNLIYDTYVSGQAVTKGESGKVNGEQTPVNLNKCARNGLLNKKGVTCGTNGCFTDYCYNSPDSTPRGSGTFRKNFQCAAMPGTNNVMSNSVNCNPLTCKDGECA